jgi:hypothetical protein
MVAAATVAVTLSGRSDTSRVLATKAFGLQIHHVHAPANAWWVLALIGGVMGVAGGAAVVLAGSRWPGLGARYDAPARPRPAPDPEAAAWDALDHGDDPTAGEPVRS